MIKAKIGDYVLFHTGMRDTQIRKVVHVDAWSAVPESVERLARRV
jgi:hydrogenase maturation factor